MSSSPFGESDEIRQLRAEHAGAIQALQSAVRDTTRLMRLFFILSETAPLEQLLDRTLATLSELFMADIVVLLEARGSQGFTARAALGLPADRAAAPATGATDPHAAAALQSGMPVLVPDVEATADVKPWLRELGAESVVWLPVLGEHAARGVLVLARCRPGPFARTDVDLLVVMAYRIGLVLERAAIEQDRRALETRLRRAEKDESLGRMAAAIAHHFNNMLGAVAGSLDLALTELPAGDPARDYISRAREAARRAGVTSGLMLAYLGQTTDRREPVNLVQLLSQALRALRGSLPPLVRLTTEFGPSEFAIVGSASQLTQAFTNLFSNALEAVGAGPGEIRVSVRAVPAVHIPSLELPAADWSPKSDTYVLLEISDTGCGMSPDTLEKIFDPFFSTKFTGRGLGLPVVLGAIRSHDGFVHVDSTLGHGTTVRAYLPRSVLSAPVPRASASPFPIATSVRRLVLLAEDEPFVLQTAQRGLEILGYEVVTAVDGVEAVERFRQHQRDVVCVVLDLAMPRMDGWTALDAIRGLQPDVPAVLASGYDALRMQAGRPPEQGVTFLPKPYGLAELRIAVRQALSTGPAPASPPPG